MLVGYQDPTLMLLVLGATLVAEADNSALPNCVAYLGCTFSLGGQ